MTRSYRFRYIISLKKVAYGLLAFLWLTSVSCYKRSAEGSILIVQQTPGLEGRSELAMINPERPEQDPVTLVDEFQKVAAPEISYPGNAVLFQAKKNPGDSWQIWQYDLESEELKQVTESDSDCEDPAYLPDGRVIYSRYVPDYSGYRVLETCNLDGSGIQQITFAPVDITSPTVLNDGRILAFAKEVYPDSKETQLIVMRPDGTKMELFYEPENDRALVEDSGVIQTEDGKIVFSEAMQGKQTKGEWVSVDYNSPTNSRKPADFESNRRTKPEFSGADQKIMKHRYIMPRPLPKKLPSAVNPESETALLVCMDANLSENASKENHRKSVKIELLGMEGSLGTVELEKDGSVYLKIQANMPFRMQTLDSDGRVVDGPSSWLQMRPNERRGCVGCHAGHTRVPDNRQPLAVQKEPIEIPLYRESIMASRLTKKTRNE